MNSIFFPKKEIEIGALTQEVRAISPEIRGVTITDTEIEVRLGDRQFTRQELDRIKQVFEAHDGATKNSAIAQQNEAVKQERKKRPETLTLEERVRRIEMILRIN